MMELTVLKYMVLLHMLFMVFTSDLAGAALPPSCKMNEWSCEDGTCIDIKLKCNGALDCPDRSDEEFVLCRKTYCEWPKYFKCAYGACVPEDALCNGVRDCADNSDEFIAQCRNETSYIYCMNEYYPEHEAKQKREECFRKASTCKNGQRLGDTLKCNGKVDCEDGSDETVEACSDFWIPNCLGMKFKCKYGGCLDHSQACNGIKECADGSDELDGVCYEGKCVLPDYPKNGNYEVLEMNNTSPRQVLDSAILIYSCHKGYKLHGTRYVNCLRGSWAYDPPQCLYFASDLAGAALPSSCKMNEWSCEDGTCIDIKLKCNGALDCPDRSDEEFVLCRKTICEWPKYFSCAYGACVPEDALCNGVRDCADNSDEVIAQCRNETSYIFCMNEYYTEHEAKQKREECFRKASTCKNGQRLGDTLKCNGKVDCEDGSDETVEACSDSWIPNCIGMKFRCKYGGCLDHSQVCNGIKDCADGSDELDGVCYEGKCVLPDYPKNGNYEVLEMNNTSPRQVLDSVILIYSCHKGYKLHGTRYVNCLRGSWAYNPPQCLSQCPLIKDPSVVYWCLSKGPLSLVAEHECGSLVPDGAIVRPECSKSIYHYTDGVIPFMHCVDGRWNRQVVTCSIQCGLVTMEGDQLIINGTSAKRGDLPWHAAIYDKTKSPYEQICGGSLISKTLVISAAHCFWTDLEKQLPARNFAAVLGKLYRPWNDPNEVDVQKSDVREIKLPPRFRGAASSFQEDLALLVLGTPVEYRSYVLPVCVDFNINFDKKQLSVGNTGKVPGWGLTAQDGKASPVLKVAELPFLDVDRCYADSPPSFYKFITADKFCAGSSNSPALCKGDSGGGLVFASYDRGEERYFLRGVVSTAPNSGDHACNAFVHTTFTQISKHQAFILEHWN